MKRLTVCILGILLFFSLMTSAVMAEQGFILLASTIGPIDSGIVSALEDAFEKDTGVRVRHVGAGTGEALKIAEHGNVDLVMAHAPSLEKKFVAAGFGVERVPFMYNDFVILGPPDDPAAIRGMKTATEALRKIAATGATFISRGDKSGTHVAELELWTKSGVKPAGPWYRIFEKGNEGNKPTLLFANSQQAYILMDRATYLSLKKQLALQVLVERDEALLNRISLIPVNPVRFPKVNSRDTAVFVKWLSSPEKGQKIVADFGRDLYGDPLFFPDSTEWKARPAR